MTLVRAVVADAEFPTGIALAHDAVKALPQVVCIGVVSGEQYADQWCIRIEVDPLLDLFA